MLASQGVVSPLLFSECLCDALARPADPQGAGGRLAACNRLFQKDALQRMKERLKKLGVHRRDRADVAQDVFEALIKSLPRYDSLCSRPGRWLNGITVHVASHYLNKAVHRREELVDPTELDVSDSDGTSVHDALVVEERRDFLFNVLPQLPADDAWILVKYHLDELSIEQIAIIRGMPASTVYKWRKRAFVAAQNIALDLKASSPFADDVIELVSGPSHETT